jgi:hypothetical protein
MERITKKWIQEKLRFGDADATIWGGLNGVGSEVLEEQSKGGAEQGRKPRETGIRMRKERLHTVDTATTTRTSLLAVSLSSAILILLVFDSPSRHLLCLLIHPSTKGLDSG